MLVWLDVETTGLHPADRILEVGMVLTEDDCAAAEVDRKRVVLTPGHGPISTWCLDTYRKNGLLVECAEAGVPPHVAEAQLLAFLQPYRTGSELLIAAGSSVHMDLLFLSRWMPSLRAVFSHQTVDVTTLLLLNQRLGGSEGDESAPAGTKPPRQRRLHRAIADAEDSLALMRWFLGPRGLAHLLGSRAE